jgi:FixJ family two-component response regulator
MASEQTVFIVEDDAATRDSLALLLGLKSYRTRAFASAEDFLRAFEPQWAGCLLLDVKMSGMSGLDLQAALGERGIALPVIVMTAFGDVATVRTALKAGALDFLEKPVIPATMLAAVRAALALDEERRRAAQVSREADARYGRLTAREREVMDLIVDGCHNQEIADKLQISPRTVQVHRARVMEKLEVDRVVHLVRIAQNKS